MSDKNHAAKVKRQAVEQMHLDKSILTNPTAVNEVTYSKGGVTSAIEYDNPSYFGRSCR
jgi:hypothetical protein